MQDTDESVYYELDKNRPHNGLVSVLIGRVAGETLEIDVWLMSCRVLKREMELAMFDTLIEQCHARGIRKIIGVYIPTKKNLMVAGLYGELGFTSAADSVDGQQSWQFEVSGEYTAKSSHIHRTAGAESPQAVSSQPSLK
jgi:predicted enzyme involved in methoxymalonyl-ACP biosynthesis